MYGFTTLFVVASATFSLLASAAPTQAASELEKRDNPTGIDVTETHGHIDWKKYKDSGVDYGYVMATYRDDYKNPRFKDQYYGCRDAGLLYGAYHVAAPSKSSGDDQADYFYNNGGKWTDDGKTLPGALVLGEDPKGPSCYDLSPSKMVSWIRHFSNEYHDKTTRYPVIVTTYDWWKGCTDNNTSFSSTHRLWLANGSKRPGGWSQVSFTETSDPTETKPGRSKWNGSYDSLKKIC